MKAYSHPNVPREVTWVLPPGQQLEGATLACEVSDQYDMRMAALAGLPPAPGPTGVGYRNHDEEPTDCGIPGCFVCEGKL